jgi:hypothetical protein
VGLLFYMAVRQWTSEAVGQLFFMAVRQWGCYSTWQ